MLEFQAKTAIQNGDFDALALVAAVVELLYVHDVHRASSFMCLIVIIERLLLHGEAAFICCQVENFFLFNDVGILLKEFQFFFRNRLIAQADEELLKVVAGQRELLLISIFVVLVVKHHGL